MIHIAATALSHSLSSICSTPSDQADKPCDLPPSHAHPRRKLGVSIGLAVIALLALVLTACDDYAQAHLETGNSLYAAGDDEQTIADYDQAIELPPHLATTYLTRGLIHQKKVPTMCHATETQLQSREETEIELEHENADTGIMLQTYKHPTGAFTIDYPKRWKATEENGVDDVISARFGLLPGLGYHRFNLYRTTPSNRMSQYKDVRRVRRNVKHRQETFSLSPLADSH